MTIIIKYRPFVKEGCVKAGVSRADVIGSISDTIPS